VFPNITDKIQKSEFFHPVVIVYHFGGIGGIRLEIEKFGQLFFQTFLRTEYKILDYTGQAKEITKGMVEVLTKQKKGTAGAKELDQWMKNLEQYGGEFEYLKNQLNFMVTQLGDLKKIYNEAVSNSNKKIVYGQRVQNPIPADKKSYPVRSMIMFLSTLAALFVAMLVILVLENKKNA